MDSNRQQGSGPNGGGGYRNASSNGGRGAAGARGDSVQRFTGMVVLGGGAKVRGPAQASGKLTVPKPVNLPSMRKEHGGNDPTTQLVAPGGISGWNKRSDSQPGAVAPGAGWQASVPTKPGAAPWMGPGQPGGPPLLDSFAGPNSRAFPPLDASTARLDAEDYPTLGAGTKQTSQFASSKSAKVPPALPHRSVDSRIWSEDERDGRLNPNWRERELQDDERYIGRGLSDDFRGGSRSRLMDDVWDDDLPGLSGFGKVGSGGIGRSFGGSGGAVWDKALNDEELFPTPRGGPPSARLTSPAAPPPPPPKRDPLPERDLEREAFQAELERVAAALEAEKMEKAASREQPDVAVAPPPPPAPRPSYPPVTAPVPPAPAPPPPPSSKLDSSSPDGPFEGPSAYPLSSVRAAAPPPSVAAPTKPPSPGAVLPPAEATAQAPSVAPDKTADEKAVEKAERIARQESIRKRIQEREEEERRRKEAAAAKLKALEDQIARRAAEEAVEPAAETLPDAVAATDATEDGYSGAAPSVQQDVRERGEGSGSEEQEKELASESDGWVEQQQQQWSSAPQVVDSPGRPHTPTQVNSRVQQQEILSPDSLAPVSNSSSQSSNMWTMQNVDQQAAGSGQMPGMSWGQPGMLGAGIFGSGLFANATESQQSVNKVDDTDIKKSGHVPQSGADPSGHGGVTSKDAAVKEVKGGQLGKGVVGAPGSSGGGKPRGSSGNLVMQDTGEDGTGGTLGGMAYNWGPNLVGGVIHFSQRQRETSSGSNVNLPAHLDPSPAKRTDGPVVASNGDAPSRPASRPSAEHTAPPSSGVDAAQSDVITDVFGDGVNALPSDLALEGPVPMDAHHLLSGLHPQAGPMGGAPSYIHAGGMPVMHVPSPQYAVGGYGGMLGPGRSGSPWGHQPPPPPPPQQQQQRTAEGEAVKHQHAQFQQQQQTLKAPPPPAQSKQTAPQPQQPSDSFYVSAGYMGGKPMGSPSMPPGSMQSHPLLMGHPSPFTHFGQFGQATAPFGGGHFGQLGHFGQTSFMPSGKQPDWSNSAAQSSGQASGPNTHSMGFTTTSLEMLHVAPALHQPGAPPLHMADQGMTHPHHHPQQYQHMGHPQMVGHAHMPPPAPPQQMAPLSGQPNLQVHQQHQSQQQASRHHQYQMMQQGLMGQVLHPSTNPSAGVSLPDDMYGDSGGQPQMTHGVLGGPEDPVSRGGRPSSARSRGRGNGHPPARNGGGRSVAMDAGSGKGGRGRNGSGGRPSSASRSSGGGRTNRGGYRGEEVPGN